MATLAVRVGEHSVRRIQPVIASDRRRGILHRHWLDTQRTTRVWHIFGTYSEGEMLLLRSQWMQFGTVWDWTPPGAGSPIKVMFGAALRTTPENRVSWSLDFELIEQPNTDT